MTSIHLSGTVSGGGLPPVFGDPERLAQFAGSLDSLAEEVLNLGHEGLTAATDIAVQAHWTGPAAEAYLTFCRTRLTAASAVAGPLHEIAAAVRGYAAALAEQQRQVHSAIRSMDMITDPTVESHRVSQAQWRVIEATGATENAVRQAANRVEAAKGELDRLARELEVSEASREFLDHARDAALAFATDTANGVFDGIEIAQRAAFAQLLKAEGLYKDGKLTLAQLRAARLRFLSKLGELDRLPHPLNTQGLRVVAGSLTVLDGSVRAINIPKNIRALISPDDSGLWRLGDRVAAGASLGATGLTFLAAVNVLDGVPGVDVIPACVDVGVAAYYGIKYVAQNWHTVSHAVDSMGHAELNIMKSEVRFASGAEHLVTSSVRSLFRL